MVGDLQQLSDQQVKLGHVVARHNLLLLGGDWDGLAEPQGSQSSRVSLASPLPETLNFLRGQLLLHTTDLVFYLLGHVIDQTHSPPRHWSSGSTLTKQHHYLILALASSGSTLTKLFFFPTNTFYVLIDIHSLNYDPRHTHTTTQHLYMISIIFDVIIDMLSRYDVRCWETRKREILGLCLSVCVGR